MDFENKKEIKSFSRNFSRMSNHQIIHTLSKTSQRLGPDKNKHTTKYYSFETRFSTDDLVRPYLRLAGQHCKHVEIPQSMSKRPHTQNMNHWRCKSENHTYASQNITEKRPRKIQSNVNTEMKVQQSSEEDVEQRISGTWNRTESWFRNFSSNWNHQVIHTISKPSRRGSKRIRQGIPIT